MIGMTHQVSRAPPVKNQSTRFIVASMATIDTILMPTAVCSAVAGDIPVRQRMTVSNAILVSNPLTVASIMIDSVDHGMLVIWKKRIVPKSPIEHPTRHQKVFLALARQVSLQYQKLSGDRVVDNIYYGLIIEPQYINHRPGIIVRSGIHFQGPDSWPDFNSEPVAGTGCTMRIVKKHP